LPISFEASFTHTNQIKAFKAGIDATKADEETGVSWGPQIDNKIFNYSAKLAIFWLYVLIYYSTQLFPRQANLQWLEKQKESLAYLYDYLKISKSSLADLCLELDKTFAINGHK
jgi:hypothetical protein